MHYINGLWIEGVGESFHSENPSTGQTLWQGRAATAAEVADAVGAAHQAFAEWSQLPLIKRLEYLRKFNMRVEEKKAELARLISEETGKAPWDAQSEVAAVIAKLANSEAAYGERTGTKSKTSPVGEARLSHRPHGVMAIFSPYNFPVHLANGHILPALLAGNTIVLKPSELTPKSTSWMVEQYHEINLPKGVINLVQGGRESGVQLAAANVDGILFTGSSATGKAIHAQLAGRPEIMLALEMGGNNPLIVNNVKDTRAAAYETILSAFTGTGQRCTCARRLILPRWPGREEFINQVVVMAQALRIGAPDAQPEPFMGPLINRREANKILEAQESLIAAGARPLLKAVALRPPLPFISPAILDVSDVKSLPDKEYFGPLLQIIRVETLTEAVEVANRTSYGLSASLISDNPDEFDYVSTRLRAGLLNWNRQTTGASGAAPFGGVGLSGNHRPAGYYAADYCAYPVASVVMPALQLPEKLAPGVTLPAA
jgi:succinylglutamic semialdehyde dehydrogenase